MLYSRIGNRLLLPLILAPPPAVADHTPFLFAHDTVSKKNL